MSSIQHRYTALETVVVEKSAPAVLPKLLQEYKYTNVFILSSNTLATKTKVIKSLLSDLGAYQTTVYHRVRSHTPRADVLSALDRARQINAEVVVAIGGGSIIDAAKAVQFGLNYGITNSEELVQFAQFADGSRGSKRADLDGGKITPVANVRIIAVPTTLSGAEFSDTAGILDSNSGNKEGYRARDLYPRAIVYDPELGINTPEWLWLSTAIRSLDHAIEGYCSPKAYPYLEGQFLHALRLFSTSLRAIKANPNDLDARALNQQAVWLACCGLGKVSHGASHGIGYILGSLCAVPHGYTSCVMLPAVLQWNAEINRDRQQPLAEALGNTSESAAQQVKQLVDDLGLPTSLQAVGVKQKQLQEIAERAYQHPVVRANPRAIESPTQVLEILQLAWD